MYGRSLLVDTDLASTRFMDLEISSCIPHRNILALSMACIDTRAVESWSGGGTSDCEFATSGGVWTLKSLGTGIDLYSGEGLFPR